MRLDAALEWAKSKDAPKDGLKVSRLDPHYVYVFFDSAGAAQYVGITSRIKRRIAEHRRNSFWCKSWFETVYFEMPTRRAALDMEKRLVQVMKPQHNKIHS
jgi:predicted GIY-YIG superfamily endonuclease